jgi:carbohydrate kinase (thermoresistant glucokinase family)
MTMRIVVMGVSGCGKTTVGEKLALQLDAKFIDGDDLHPEENKAKMAAGIALNDEDRWPWLDTVGAALASEEKIVIACSALKRKYRERILSKAGDAIFFHLEGSRELLAGRMASRSNHFMPVSLLDSQLAALEPLEFDEPGHTVNINQPVTRIVETALSFIRE